jgi:thiamine-monophosphate kinase
VSDGLVGDLSKLLRASGVGADIEVARVPLSAAARAAHKAEPTVIETILTGGDDFEVIATIPPRKLKAFLAAARRTSIRVTEIGRVTAAEGARFRSAEGRELTFKHPSFSHF